MVKRAHFYTRFTTCHLNALLYIPLENKMASFQESELGGKGKSNPRLMLLRLTCWVFKYPPPKCRRMILRIQVCLGKEGTAKDGVLWRKEYCT